MPHGGRDFTAAQAKAHEDITFVWWVIDQIMDLDRRAWWLKHWVHGTRAFLTPQVFDLREPVLLVCNDNDDAYWQLIGTTAARDVSDQGKVSHLVHAIDEDPTLLDVLDLRPGEIAERGSPNTPWVRGRM